MGGQAFAQAYAPGSPTIRIQRMSLKDYTERKALCLRRLERHIGEQRIDVPPEAPEKESFGDIDITIDGLIQCDLQAIARILHAKAVVVQSTTDLKNFSFAVPFDLDAPCADKDVVIYHNCQGDLSRMSHNQWPEPYYQLDLCIDNTGFALWHTFCSSYSDTGPIIGQFLRRLGLVVNDKGIHLRLKELDDSKAVPYLAIPSQDGLIALTSDVEQALGLLGLSYDRFNTGFNTRVAYYDWLGSCKLLFPDLVEVHKSSVKVKKQEARAVYTGFFRDWLPQHPELCKKKDWTSNENTVDAIRTDVLAYALDFFPQARSEYEQKGVKIMHKWHNETAVFLLRPMIKQITGRSDKTVVTILRGMRRFIVFKNGVPFIDSSGHSDADSELRYFLDSTNQHIAPEHDIKQWLGKYWQDLKVLGDSI